MRILLVNKFAHLEGGATRYALDLYHLLQSAGHEVAFFAMKQQEGLAFSVQGAEKELYERWGKYWVGYVETKHLRFDWQGARTAGRFLWSWEAQHKVKHLIRDFRPDIVHLNAISHQISPSIIPVIKKLGIPMVMTVHDYSLVYPDYVLKVFQYPDVFNRRFFRVVQRRDVRGSRAASLLSWAEFIFHRFLRVYHNVNAFIAPSQFMKSLLERTGFRQVVHIPNFYPPSPESPAIHRGDVRPSQPKLLLQRSRQRRGEPSEALAEEGHTNASKNKWLVFYGRVTPEKGIGELLESYHRCRKKGVTIPPLLVIGSGNQETVVRSFCDSSGGMITWRPFEGVEPHEAYGGAVVVLVPSYPYLENFPYAVLEAFAHGKPVISSGLGGLPEMVEEGVRGWNVLGQTEDASREEYIERLSRVLERAVVMSESELEQRGRNARGFVEKLNPKWYYEEVMRIYHKVINPKISNS